VQEKKNEYKEESNGLHPNRIKLSLSHAWRYMDLRRRCIVRDGEFEPERDGVSADFYTSGQR
jgi:hypothetical protein